MADGEPAGYLKLNIDEAQSEDTGADTLEIERIYLSSRYHRNGLGKHLINHALANAAQHNKTRVWLGVWEKNKPAIRILSKKWALSRPERISFRWAMKHRQI